MSDHILSKMGVCTGDIIIDGSFARNALFCGLLAQLRPAQTVLCAADQAGTARGAAMLAHWPNSRFEVEIAPVAAANLAGLADYRSAWLEKLGSVASRA